MRFLFLNAKPLLFPLCFGAALGLSSLGFAESEVTAEDIPPPPPQEVFEAKDPSTYSPLIQKRARRAMKALELSKEQEEALYPLLCEHYRRWLDNMAHRGGPGQGGQPPAAGGTPPQGKPPSGDMKKPEGEPGAGGGIESVFQEILTDKQLQQLQKYFQEEMEKMKPGKGGGRPSGPPPGGGGPGGGGPGGGF